MSSNKQNKDNLCVFDGNISHCFDTKPFLNTSVDTVVTGRFYAVKSISSSVKHVIRINCCVGCTALHNILVNNRFHYH
jgi:hypothetical protein